MSLYVPIRLTDKLILDRREPIIGPVEFHSRTGHILPDYNNEMQSELDSLKQYCSDSKMSINQKKQGVCCLTEQPNMTSNQNYN